MTSASVLGSTSMCARTAGQSTGQHISRPVFGTQVSARRSLRRGLQWRARAEEDKKESDGSLNVKESLLEDKLPNEKPLIGESNKRDLQKEDKRLAVVTGAVSIVIGVAYLAAVTFLNARGNDLQPPPPEAFGL